MKYIYVSRNANRSGYHILEHLINADLYPIAVILPETSINPKNFLSEVKQFHGEPLRFTKSIKLLARSNNVPVLELKSIKTEDAWSYLNDMTPDLIVLGGGWPELIPEKVISLPKLGVLNTHPSILPDYRGTDIHRWQIAAGVKKSGVTIHYIDKHFDTGDILDQAIVDVEPKDSPQDLFEKIACISGPLMESTIKRIWANSPKKTKGKIQIGRKDNSRYYGRWDWENSDFLKLNWRRGSSELVNFIRACSQESFIYNGPHTSCNGEKFIIREADIVTHKLNTQTPGKIIDINDDGAIISTGSEFLMVNLKLIQRATEKGWPTEPNTSLAYDAKKNLENCKIKIGDCFI